MHRNFFFLVPGILLLGMNVAASARGDDPFPPLAEEYSQQVLPLVKQFCLDCHSTTKAEGELDLERFISLTEARRGTKVWLKVVEMLDHNEMPPKDAKQPGPAERARLKSWAERFLQAVALADEGDPGPVLLRRLTNAEYTYTIRDLTGVPLEPAREFPADSAAGEGFTNTGHALVMSPALLSKYLAAGKAIAHHAVLLPEGFRFSPSSDRRDWTNETLARIRDIYGEHTDAGGASQVNLQGIVFKTNEGGRLAVDRYIAATLEERASLTEGTKTIAQVARERSLNAKYLGVLWSILNDGESSPVLDVVRSHWRNALPADAPHVTREIAAWQSLLWRFSSVGHIGKVNGPKAWQEPVTPLAGRLEVRRKLTPQPGQQEMTIYLHAGDAGDGNANDFVVWQQPRLVAAGRADIMLRDVRSVDPALFGKHPDGSAIDPTSLCVQAPSVIEIRLPADLVSGMEFVTTAVLHGETGREGSVQLQLSEMKPSLTEGLLPMLGGDVKEENTQSNADSGRPIMSAPLLVNDSSAARQRFEDAFAKFRAIFPVALCYSKIVPVDEVVTLTLFHREDEPIQRLMLDDMQIARLNQAWDELHFVSNDALTLVDALEQLLEYASQDGDPKLFAPLRQPILDRAAAFRQSLVSAEPKQLQALLAFAAQACRRPLTPAESQELLALYHRLRAQELPHEEAFRFTLARVFMSPAFLYRLETAPAGTKSATVTDWELASRLSYFLWSSQPDAELREIAAAGRLHEPEVLRTQARRLLADPRSRRLATEFACQWLQIYEFSEHDEKSIRHFPEFAELRGNMYEEAILFFADLFQKDASILTIWNADHTFVNQRLATFYGLPFTAGPDWQRVDGLRKQDRGGILGMAATLAKQSGASRTSPILRGNWVSEVLLGEQLPRPPRDVPRLPEEEAASAELTVRQLTEKHTTDARCSSCHRRIDPYGFALERYDAIGRRRDRDSLDRSLDDRTQLPDGREIAGLPGLRDYLVNTRRDHIVRQFNRKLLGFALGRAVQLSDEPLLAEMQQQLSARQYRISAAVETIINSRQFREIRGRDTPFEFVP